MLNSPLNNHTERLRDSLKLIAKFMRVSRHTAWSDWLDLDTADADLLTTAYETLDKEMEEVYDVYISKQARNDLRGISVILADGTVGTLAGFQVNLEKINNNKEDSK